jgi:carboxylate-amine ligase
VNETIAITALLQALVAKLYKLKKQNMSFIIYTRALINENKWRASRYGLEGKLIDFGKQEEVPLQDLIPELLDFVDDVVDELGCRWAVEYIPVMLKNGTGADRQLAVFNQTKSLQAVVDYIVSETKSGL